MIDKNVSFEDSVASLEERVEYIYISVDLDVLDPSIAPGVGHPESGGLSMIQLVDALRSAFSTGKVNHADIVELNPLIDKTGVTAVVARDVVKEILTGFALS